MNCPDCGAETVAFAVPDDLREHADDEPALALCTHCLSLYPTATADPNPDFAAVSDAFPTGESATAMALVVGLLDSLALHRTEASHYSNTSNALAWTHCSFSTGWQRTKRSTRKRTSPRAAGR